MPKFGARGPLVALLSALALGALLRPAQGGLAGSAHDFGYPDLCGACHVAHEPEGGPPGGVGDIPLWDHETTTATHTPYFSLSMEATPGAPTGISIICLSCHDGTVAIDSYDGVTGTDLMTGINLVGVDLSNDHPIGFTYDSNLALQDNGLYDPSVRVWDGGSATIEEAVLDNGVVQCTTCHNVHASTSKLLRFSTGNAGSGLCLNCHKK